MDDLNIFDILKTNERVLDKWKPNKFIYCTLPSLKMLPLGILWGCFDVFFIFMVFTSDPPIFFKIFVGIFMIFHLYPCYSVVTSYISRKIEWKKVNYIMTDQRVIRVGGVLGVEIDSIDYHEIDHLKIHTGLIEKMFHVGSISIQSANQEIEFIGIEEPMRAYKKLNQTSFDVKSDIEYPNQYRPKTNPGYSTDYDLND
ncbi:MAG: PH domain-containing protein [Traorella sp.]